MIALRQSCNALIGSIAGLYGSTWIIAAIAASAGKPVTGCACITIGLGFGLLGGLVGAASAEA